MRFELNFDIKHASKSIDKVDPTKVPDGEYRGLWSGYTIRILLPTWTESPDIKMNEGVRGMNCECQVKVIDSQVYAI
jgi:hypothetical protein